MNYFDELLQGLVGDADQDLQSMIDDTMPGLAEHLAEQGDDYANV